MKKNKIGRGTFVKACKTIPQIAQELAPVYRQFLWTWGDSKIPPTADEISANIYEILAYILTGEAKTIESGGIRVSLEDSGELLVSFIKEYSIFEDET